VTHSLQISHILAILPRVLEILPHLLAIKIRDILRIQACNCKSKYTCLSMVDICKADRITVYSQPTIFLGSISFDETDELVRNVNACITFFLCKA